MFPAVIGGHWENITWENIYGNYAVNLFGFTENHGTGYNQSLGPTNATGREKTIDLSGPLSCQCTNDHFTEPGSGQT